MCCEKKVTLPLTSILEVNFLMLKDKFDPGVELNVWPNVFIECVTEGSFICGDILCTTLSFDPS